MYSSNVGWDSVTTKEERICKGQCVTRCGIDNFDSYRSYGVTSVFCLQGVNLSGVWKV